jgi:glycerophosphoryl diester phosphodiesterase
VAQGTQLTQILLGYAVMESGVAKIRITGDTLDGLNILPLSTAKSIADGVSVSITGTYGPNVTKDWVDQAHAAGLIVHSWTFSKVNAIEAAEEYFKYLDMGMDGYFSNYPNLGVLARDKFVQQDE